MSNIISLNELTATSNGFEVFEEAAGPTSSWKNLKIRGVFQRADAKNQNGRIYPFAVLEQSLYAVSETLKSRNMLGCADHPTDSSPIVMLKDASHVVTNLQFQGKDMIGEAVVFDDPGPAGTPAGRILGALIRNGCTIGISSRGLGSLGRDYVGNDIVEQYQLITFDCVHNPSTHKAYVFQVNENANYDDVIKKELERKERLERITGIRNSLRPLFNGSK